MSLFLKNSVDLRGGRYRWTLRAEPAFGVPALLLKPQHAALAEVGVVLLISNACDTTVRALRVTLTHVSLFLRIPTWNL